MSNPCTPWKNPEKSGKFTDYFKVVISEFQNLGRVCAVAVVDIGKRSLNLEKLRYWLSSAHTNPKVEAKPPEWLASHSSAPIGMQLAWL